MSRTVYHAIYPDTVIALTVIHDESHSLLAQDSTGQRWRFRKWPRRYFGDALCGPFSRMDLAFQKLNNPLPAFDYNGNRI